MEDLFAKNLISKQDIETVYEALFLRVVVGFELFLETLFVDILEGRVRYKPEKQVARHAKYQNTEVMMAILFQGKRYMEWLPFDKTEQRARLHLSDGRPFTILDDGKRGLISRIETIRNVIAHSSKIAKTKFNSEIIGNNQALLPEEKTPPGFLRSLVRNAPAECRFEIYAAELGEIATKIRQCDTN